MFPHGIVQLLRLDLHLHPNAASVLGTALGATLVGRGNMGKVHLSCRLGGVYAKPESANGLARRFVGSTSTPEEGQPPNSSDYEVGGSEAELSSLRVCCSNE